MQNPKNKEEKPTVKKRINCFWYLVLILGLITSAMFFSLMIKTLRLNSERRPVVTEVSKPKAEATSQPGEKTSLAEIEEIENDLLEMDFSNLDQELDEISKELALP